MNDPGTSFSMIIEMCLQLFLKAIKLSCSTNKSSFKYFPGICLKIILSLQNSSCWITTVQGFSRFNIMSLELYIRSKWWLSRWHATFGILFFRKLFWLRQSESCGVSRENGDTAEWQESRRNSRGGPTDILCWSNKCLRSVGQFYWDK